MSNDVKITKFFNTSAPELFPFFLQPSLIEQWSYPDGMRLKVPKFEAKDGGRYRYEHTNEKGTYVCEGHVEKIIPDISLQMVDEWIKMPDGKMMAENLPCEVQFKPMGDGCEVTVIQTGFTESRTARECEAGWLQSLEHLHDLVNSTVYNMTSKFQGKGSSPMDQTIH